MPGTFRALGGPDILSPQDSTLFQVTGSRPLGGLGFVPAAAPQPAPQVSVPIFPYDYLEGVMHARRGDPGMALAAWRGIRPRDQDPYIRFRWLTDRLPADDAEALKALPSLAWKTPDGAEEAPTTVSPQGL